MNGPPNTPDKLSKRSRALLAGIIVTCFVIAVTFHAVNVNQPGFLIASTPSQTWDDSHEQVPSDGSLRTTFELRNPGNQSVRILEIEKPRGTSRITVSTTILESVENVLRFVVRTDSITTPTVPLQWTIIRRREPPAVLTAQAELTFLGNPLDEAPRNIRVVTVEGTVRTLAPRIESSLPFLTFRLKSVAEKPLSRLKNTVERTYDYMAVFSEATPTSSFQGEVLVIDPWSHTMIRRLRSSGLVRSAFSCVPSHLSLSVDPQAHDVQASFLLLYVPPLGRVELETGDPALLERFVLKPVGSSVKLGSQIATKFELQLVGGNSVPAATYQLLLKERGLASRSVELPVRITRSDDHAQSASSLESSVRFFLD
jgi:hypothetical protein